MPDIDGDGMAELLVGEPGSAVPGHFGRIHLFSGDTGERLYGIDSPNPEASGHFGAALQGTGDVDGDGRGDLLVGAPGESPEGSPDEAGRAYVFSGATGALLHELASPNEEERGVFGAAVSVVPNASGDGHPGLLVGAARSHVDPEGEGRAYLFDGATGALLETVLPPDGPSPGSFGHAVAGLRDVDGDGFGDFLLGAPNDSPGGVQEAGRAYYSGTPDASPSVVVEAEPLDSPVPSVVVTCL